MNITFAQYRNDYEGVASSIAATIDGQELLVPLDTSNRHYAAILEWVAEGNTIQDASS
jgi:hypothetical protein